MNVLRVRYVARAIFCCGLVLAASAGLRAEKQHVAERFDIEARVQPDGSLEVDERIRFRFTGGEYTFVTRAIPADFTDGVEVLSASMDGQELPWGDEEGQIEVDYDRRRVDLRWRFAPTVDTTRVFSLRYRLKGIVRKGEGQDWLAWEPFPERFDYPIVDGTVSLRWRPDVQLRRQPHVEGPVAAFAPIDSGLALDVANYRQRDDAVVVIARFEPGAFLGPEPQWQRDEARAGEMGPAFIAGACMVIAATVLALWIFFMKYRRDRAEPLPTSRTVTEPPEALAPALAGAISPGRLTITGTQALATVFDLAGRGVITIEEQQHAGFLKQARFLLRRGKDVQLAPHEAVVRDALFNAKEQPPRLDKAMRGLAMRLGGFKKAVKQELGGLGYLDADRADGAKGLVVGGGVVMAFAFGIFILIIATNVRLGEASLLVPGAFFVSGVTMLVVGASFSTLTTRGARAALQWKAYRRHLKDAAKERRLPSKADEISRLLPYATSLGVAPSWLKAFKHMPEGAIPPWLITLGPAGTNAAFVALLASSTSSAGHGGGAGGGGVAGGGSSSAG